MTRFSIDKFKSYLKFSSDGIVNSHLRFIPEMTKYVYYFSSIPSTHRLIKTDEYSKLGTVLIAGEQTAGIGRISERKWISEEGGLYFSFLVGFNELQDIFAFRKAISVAMVHTMWHFIPEYKNQIILKWPNDFYFIQPSSKGQNSQNIHSIKNDNNNIENNSQNIINNQNHNNLQSIEDFGFALKLGGMLIDNEFVPPQLQNEVGAKIKCFPGIGININQKNWNKNFPEGESLFGLLGKEIDIESFLAEFFNQLNTKWMRVEDKILQEEYVRVLGGLGQHVKVMPKRKEGDEYYFGKVIKITEHGNIIVKKEGTNEEIELIGEEVSLRPVLNH